MLNYYSEIGYKINLFNLNQIPRINLFNENWDFFLNCVVKNRIL